ncbi:SGNH/GDSL hydrolase family protein [Aeromicrobium sp. CF3.5]|uniref:SGNH/GDSL hydrolase family protein n=1 Tax=Aeromicrobium sp. CF3.5 TaxID=3373078 RepID=UPI003EE48484
MTLRRAGAALTLAAVALVMVSACTSTASDPEPAETTASAAPSTPAELGTAYVALGDSYSAGPGIQPADTEQPQCFRSETNWPNLLADAEGLDLADVSCSGATTESALDGVGNEIPAQLDALGEDTSLVTLGIGGNDGGLFSSLIQSCATAAATCQQYVDQQAPEVLSMISTNVADLLGQIAERSPDAQVALVGYLRLAPQTGTCELLGVPAEAADDARRIEQGLEDALAAAATSADVPFVSMREVSTGHDVCAGDEAWVNGAQVTDGDGIVFHPRSAGMQAVAAEVARSL